MNNIPDIFLFDMDGTLYLGHRIIKGADIFLKKLREKNIKCVFLSNNSSKNRYDYVRKLNAMNIKADIDDIFTSLNATIVYLKENNINRIYPLGTPSFEKELIDNNIVLTEDNPQAIVLGFDKTLNYDKINKAYQFLIKDIPFIATHPDILCPTENGFIPDIGCFIAMFEKACNRVPVIIGKPNVSMVELVLKKYNMKKEQCAMVGDRLYTDMRMAVNANIVSILVLSGETNMQMYEKSNIKVDIVVNSVIDLIEYYKL